MRRPGRSIRAWSRRSRRSRSPPSSTGRSARASSGPRTAAPSARSSSPARTKATARASPPRTSRSRWRRSSSSACCSSTRTSGAPPCTGCSASPDGPGLSDVLMGAADLDDALVHLPAHHLTVLPAGAPPGHPAELLGSASMRRVLDTLAHALRSDPHRHAAGRAAGRSAHRGADGRRRADDRPRRRHAEARDRAALAGLDMSKVLGLVLNEAGRNGNDSDLRRIRVHRGLRPIGSREF